MKNNLLEKMDVIDTAAGELEGISDQLNCIACALTSRSGAPSQETLERALLAAAAHINRISDEITDAATEIIHKAGKTTAS